MDSPTVREERVIRRYANRKLYDSTESRYVTLQDVEALVRRGVEVRVVDNRTGEDVTQTTLAQILADAGRRGDPRYSLGHLLALFRRPDLEERVRGFLGLRSEEKTAGAPPAEERERAAREFLGGLQRTAEDLQKRLDERLAQILRDLDPLRRLTDEVRTLAARVEALERALDVKPPPGRKGRRPPGDSG